MELISKYFKQGLLLSLCLGALFAFLGVYNTHELPYFKRFVFWSTTMIVGLLSTGLWGRWVFEKLFPQQHLLIKLLAIAALISVPVTLVLAAFDHKYGLDWSAYIWLLQYRYVIVVSSIVIGGGYFVLKAQGVLDTEPPQPDSVEIAKNNEAAMAVRQFLTRLPAELHDTQLFAVASEDHYLRVITDKGESLILMRLSDALRELEPVPGMQTHRSWWVGSDAIIDSERTKGKTILRIKSGESVPVSRTFDKTVKEQLAHLSLPQA